MRPYYFWMQATIFMASLHSQACADVSSLFFSGKLEKIQYAEQRNSVRRGARIVTTATAFPFSRTSLRLLTAPSFRVQGRFVRTWLLSGRQFCQRLREAGIAVSQWQPAASGRSDVYECVFDETYHANGKFASQEIFLVVRGTTDGTISSVRAKISLDEADSQNLLRQEISKVLGSGLIDQSQKITVAARAMAERKTIGHLS